MNAATQNAINEVRKHYANLLESRPKAYRSSAEHSALVGLQDAVNKLEAVLKETAVPAALFDEGIRE